MSENRCPKSELPTKFQEWMAMFSNVPAADSKAGARMWIEFLLDKWRNCGQFIFFSMNHFINKLFQHKPHEQCLLFWIPTYFSKFNLFSCCSEQHSIRKTKAGHLACSYLFSVQRLTPHICLRRSSTGVRQDKSLVHWIDFWSENGILLSSGALTFWGIF